MTTYWMIGNDRELRMNDIFVAMKSLNTSQYSR